MADSHYVIKPRPPVRAFFIGAVSTLLGAGLLVASLVLDWHVVVAVLGAVVLALGILVFVLGLLSASRQTVHLTFTSKGYSLSRSGWSGEGKWVGVTRVTQSGDGRRVTIIEGDEVGAILMFAPGSVAEIDTILADMADRLDEAKGYRNL